LALVVGLFGGSAILFNRLWGFWWMATWAGVMISAGVPMLRWYSAVISA
jgi:hypothetical protein